MSPAWMSLVTKIKSLSINDRSATSMMKRKRNSEELQTCDLVLIDANGRSVRAHRALLVDKSEYFARVLDDCNLTELHLNENYLIELIHYLYSHDSDYGAPPPVEGAQLAVSPDVLYGTAGVNNYDDSDTPQSPPSIMTPPEDDDADIQMGGQEVMTLDTTTSSTSMEHSTLLTHGDIEVLVRMLVLSSKYGFRQLYRNLINEINYKLGPLTAITVYKSARELGLAEFLDQTRMMILSWLSQLQATEEFLSLTEDSIRDIFDAESPEIESESKLDALSAWWSHNKQADMTDLWVKIMMST